jgi:hypothetical protein
MATKRKVTAKSKAKIKAKINTKNRQLALDAAKSKFMEQHLYTGDDKIIVGSTPVPQNIGFSVGQTLVSKTMSEDDLFPSLEIEHSVYDKIQYWIDKTNIEVSGLGRVVYDAEHHVWRVVSAYLVDQVNSAADTTLDAEAIGRLMFETKDDPGQLNWWWHSHHDMDVFWSSTDIAAIEELGQHGFFTATVFNKRRQSLSCAYQNVPFRMFSNELDFEVLSRTANKEWDDEFDEKVKEKVWVASKKKEDSAPRTFWYNNELFTIDEDDEGADHLPVSLLEQIRDDENEYDPETGSPFLDENDDPHSEATWDGSKYGL